MQARPGAGGFGQDGWLHRSVRGLGGPGAAAGSWVLCPGVGTPYEGRTDLLFRGRGELSVTGESGAGWGGGIFRWGEREAAAPPGWARPRGRSLPSVGLRRRRENLTWGVSGERKYRVSGNRCGGVEKTVLRGRKGWMCVRVENGGDVASPGKKIN